MKYSKGPEPARYEGRASPPPHPGGGASARAATSARENTRRLGGRICNGKPVGRNCPADFRAGTPRSQHPSPRRRGRGRYLPCATSPGAQIPRWHAEHWGGGRPVRRARVRGSITKRRPNGDGEVQNRKFLKRPCPRLVHGDGVAMYGNAAICVIRPQKTPGQRIVGGPNICGQPGPPAYLARYMRGRKDKTV